MAINSLGALAERVAETKCIGLQDVCDFRRDILADGLNSREEAEALIALDHLASSKDPAWTELLVCAVVEFAVWTSRPTGYVDRDTARWLIASLGAEAPAEAAMRIAFEIVREAEKVDETLLAFALRSTDMRGNLEGRDAVLAGAA